MTNTKTVYAVFTEGWDFYSTPKLDSLFFRGSDAETYAEKLRNKVYDNWSLSCMNKIYCNVYVEETEIH